MTEILTVLGNVLIVAGALVFATAALGVARFRDAYMRVSAVGTAGGLGIVFVVTGALLLQPSVSNVVKVVLIITIHLITSAVGTMAIARAAYLTGTPLERYAFDELAADSPTSGRDPEPARKPAAD
ncbi:cation:proton antiporter [Kocuria indica]|uniref:Cation:proton antiporter n=1 Tax=Kocuria marina subsp. indica TaxID=1049583 RepID=A0A6N9QW20_9MICC|nr:MULTISPECIES: monovalent cation/H(+) antiporter subunit G [Kocuria]MCT1615058.1 monovalent cation/H(+) antiporter subunit G [Kocuria marina]NDO76690.1 cation:proton antiporter [Kocuria indica]